MPSPDHALSKKKLVGLKGSHSRYRSVSQPEGPVFKRPRSSEPTEKAPSTEPRSTKERKASQKVTSSQVRKSSRDLKPISTNSSKLNIRSTSNSTANAVQKLGLDSKLTFKLPSSLSSIHSPDDKHDIENDFSSPPTSWNDDCTSLTEVKAISGSKASPDSKNKTLSSSEKPDKSTCPLCKEIVDNIFLEGFTKKGRLRMSEQYKFCTAHRRRTAEEEWKTKGYPTIDWPFLHKLVKIHREAMDEILKGERFSYYRNVYEDFLKREKHKTLQQSLIQGSGIEDFSPGYYGGRGKRIMYASYLPFDQERNTPD